MSILLSLNTSALSRCIAPALLGIGILAAAAPADAAPRTCTNREIRTIVTDYLVIACTRKNGSVKCEGGKAFCCKNDVCVEQSIVDDFRATPPPPRPPRADPGPGPGPGRVSPPQNPQGPPRADPGPGRVSPPQNPQGPPRANPSPGRIAPPASTGPNIR